MRFNKRPEKIVRPGIRVRPLTRFQKQRVRELQMLVNQLENEQHDLNVALLSADFEQAKKITDRNNEVSLLLISARNSINRIKDL